MKTLESNPLIPLIASGGLTVWLITNLKNIWHLVSSFIVSLISFNVHNAYEDNRGCGYCTRDNQLVFNKIVSASKSIWERNKQLDLYEDDVYSTEDQTYGFSIRIMYGKLVFCHKYQKADGQKMMIQTDLQVFFARKKKFIAKLQDEIHTTRVELKKQSQSRTSIRVFYGSQAYGNCSVKNKRALDSIFTNGNEHMQLFDSIKKFIANKDIYKKLNYPYKFSALIYGQPGNGKSSTILAIASELNRDVEYINLATTNVVQLMDKLNSSTKEKIFVFEDIDALNSNAFKERSDENGDGIQERTEQSQMCVINNSSDGIKVFSLSLSDLLNITDGLLSSDGSICIFTTNHIEKLDGALLRAGRMNKVIEFTYLNSETASKMVEKYLGHKVEGLRDGIKPAELQEDLLSILLGKKDESILEKYRRQ